MPPKIHKLTKNANSISEPTEIANAFNKFFSTAGSNIAESVNPTVTELERFMGEALAPEFHLGLTSPTEIVNIFQAFECKSSADINGISIKLFKAIAIEISIPLSHIFNLSLTTGTFPDALKPSRVIPVFKQGD
jgi:hypothetical protein